MVLKTVTQNSATFFCKRYTKHLNTWYYWTNGAHLPVRIKAQSNTHSPETKGNLNLKDTPQKKTHKSSIST